MLTQLFSSAVRVKLLKFLVMHTGREFSAADIAQKTNTIIRSVNKEIVKLVSTGIVIEHGKSVEVNNKTVQVKHYTANPDFLLFPEVKDLFLKMQVLDLETFKKELSKAGDVQYLVLTGKFTSAPEVSIDLLLVGKVDTRRVKAVINEFERKVGWEIDWTIMDEEDYRYRREIGDLFLYGISMAKKIEVINKLD